MLFDLPESYRAYCSDAAVRIAVGHILSSEGSNELLALPPDIEWKDLRAFHAAVLLAHQVRCEFAILLIDLWDDVWRPALDGCDFGTDIKPQSAHDSGNWNGQDLGTHSLWDNGWIGRVFDLGTKFVISPGVRVGTEDVQLSLSFRGEDHADHTAGQEFGDDWPQEEIEDGNAYTSPNLAPIRDDGTIDLNALHKAAADALSVVKTCLRK